jgi:hypothetical protein
LISFSRKLVNDHGSVVLGVDVVASNASRLFNGRHGKNNARGPGRTGSASGSDARLDRAAVGGAG